MEKILEKASHSFYNLICWPLWNIRFNNDDGWVPIVVTLLPFLLTPNLPYWVRLLIGFFLLTWATRRMTNLLKTHVAPKIYSSFCWILIDWSWGFYVIFCILLLVFWSCFFFTWHNLFFLLSSNVTKLQFVCTSPKFRHSKYSGAYNNYCKSRNNKYWQYGIMVFFFFFIV